MAVIWGAGMALVRMPAHHVVCLESWQGCTSLGGGLAPDPGGMERPADPVDWSLDAAPPLQGC